MHAEDLFVERFVAQLRRCREGADLRDSEEAQKASHGDRYRALSLPDYP